MDNRTRKATRRQHVARFAGEAFKHQGDPADGPYARELIANVAWKQPPSASVRAEVST